jgi:hypothetical protein
MLVVLELLALAAVIAGVALVSVPAALIVGGLGVVGLLESAQRTAKADK